MGTRQVATEIRMAQWAQVMREAAVCQMAAEAQPEQQILVPSGWATVCAAEEAVPEQAGSLTLRIGGAEIEVRQGFDEGLLASVCRALSSSC